MDKKYHFGDVNEFVYFSDVNKLGSLMTTGDVYEQGFDFDW
jgi:hypothetical protein